MKIDAAQYQRALGDELRKARKRRGWTRKNLQDRLACEISLQTLATYELGTRQCSVVRLAELCLALDEPPHQLLERVHQRMFVEDTSGKVRVNLANAAADRSQELLPLRKWAADRLSAGGRSGPAEVALDLSALEQLAQLCGLDTVELLRRLQGLAS